MKTSRFVTLMLGIWLLSACGPTTIRDLDARAYVPIENWVLELHRELTIPSERTRVFFQEGKQVYGVNEFIPHCQLRVRELSTQPRTVQADRFSIGRVYGTVDSIVSNGRLRLAAAGPVTIASGNGNGDGNGMTQVIYFYHMALHADRQPNVTYLVCGGGRDDPALARYPTIQDIRSSLGEYATVITPADT